MGIRSVARIKIIKKTMSTAPVTAISMDDALDVFLPDWLPVDLTSFRRLPEDYEKMTELSKILKQNGINFLKKGIIKNNFISYPIPPEIVKQMRIMNFINKDIQMQNSVWNFKGDELGLHKAFTLRGEDAIGISLLAVFHDEGGYRESLLQATLDSRKNILMVTKKNTKPEGVDFMNAVLYLAKRSIEDGY